MPEAWSKGGMIAAAQPTAAAIGAAVMRDGGNAVDATIAAALVLNVTYPMMCGLGGDVFAIIHDAKTGRTFGINGSGIAPWGASPEWFRSHGYDAVPGTGMLSVGTPGGVRAYFDILERWGTRSFMELAQPAISYALNGFVITPKLAAHFAQAEANLKRYPSSARVYLKDGRAPRAGDVLRQPDLAASLSEIAAHGPDVLYRGRLAERILTYANEHDGIWRGDEWAEHTTEIYEPPLGVTYRGGFEVYQTKPPSQGLIMLEELNLVEGFDLARLAGGNDGGLAQADGYSTHILVEAKKLAFADRNRWAGDPRMVDFPLDELMSKEFAARRRAAINPERAAGLVPGADLGLGDTTSHVAVDGNGMMVSFIHSLSNAFGSQEIAGDTGILLNNRVGRGFTLLEGHPNVIAPGKKTMHTLNTYLVLRDGKPYCVGNTPGGDGQPQWNLQVLTNLIDLGMSAAESVTAPRWRSAPGTDPVGLNAPVELFVESRMAAAVRGDLEQRGHVVKVVGPWAGGGEAQLIRVHPGNVLEGASDPRGEGVALGI